MDRFSFHIRFWPNIYDRLHSHQFCPLARSKMNTDDDALSYFDDPLKHFAGVKEVTCPRCKKRFDRDYEVYKFNFCPECRGRDRAGKRAKLLKAEDERAKGILEFCSVCNKTFRTNSPKLGVKICPECFQRNQVSQ